MKTMVLAVTATLLAGLAYSGTADAVVVSRITRMQGGPACQLSIPTTDTQARPKASGFRNEGTTNRFVICSVTPPLGTLKDINLNIWTLDGVNRSVKCTATNGPAWSAQFSTKELSTAGVGNTVQFQWTAVDFGAAAGGPLPHGYISVTCILPGQIAIPNVWISYDEDIGA